MESKPEKQSSQPEEQASASVGENRSYMIVQYFDSKGNPTCDFTSRDFKIIEAPGIPNKVFRKIFSLTT